jgi:hypothetical protein
MAALMMKTIQTHQMMMTMTAMMMTTIVTTYQMIEDVRTTMITAIQMKDVEVKVLTA